MIDNDLAYFLIIASTGTLARAADQLGISQPAVTKAIQRLERKVGVALVERTARGSVLTEAGKVFHARVSGVSLQLDSALQEARYWWRTRGPAAYRYDAGHHEIRAALAFPNTAGGAARSTRQCDNSV